MLLLFIFFIMSRVTFKDKSKNDKALCSECVPTTYSDGSKSIIHKGTWHNKFPKVKWDGKREVINR